MKICSSPCRQRVRWNFVVHHKKKEKFWSFKAKKNNQNKKTKRINWLQTACTISVEAQRTQKWFKKMSQPRYAAKAELKVSAFQIGLESWSFQRLSWTGFSPVPVFWNSLSFSQPMFLLVMLRCPDDTIDHRWRSEVQTFKNQNVKKKKKSPLCEREDGRHYLNRIF